MTTSNEVQNIMKESCNKFWGLSLEEQSKLINNGLDRLRETIGHVPMVLIVAKKEGPTTVSNLNNVDMILELVNCSAMSLRKSIEEEVE